MNGSHVDLNQINNLLNSDGLDAETTAKLEAFKSKYEELASQVSTIQSSLGELTSEFNKTSEEVTVRKEHERVSELVNYYTELNKKSLTDYEIDFRNAMMKEDGTGLLQKLFTCIEKNPTWANDRKYQEIKKEIAEMFKNPFDMKKFAKKQEEFISLHTKYKELTTKDPNNFTEISKVTARLSKLKKDIVAEGSKYIFNQNRLEILYEKHIHQLSLMGGYAIMAEKNQILDEIAKVYKPFHDRFTSTKQLEFYTKDLKNLEAKLATFGAKTETVAPVTPEITPETPVATATIENPTVSPVTEAPKSETSSTPSDEPTPASSVEETDKTNSGLHFVGFPENDSFYDDLRNLYRYGDEIEVAKEEKVDGKDYIVIKGTDKKVPKDLFLTTKQMTEEFKASMKAHKATTSLIMPGMKVTPCWPGYYNKAILKNSRGYNGADIEVRKMKLHDEIKVERVFYKGLRKFLKLEGYENYFSADSFMISPSNVKIYNEKLEQERQKRAAKNDEEVTAETPVVEPTTETPVVEETITHETPVTPSPATEAPVTEEPKEAETVSEVLDEVEQEAEAKPIFEERYAINLGRKPVTNVEPVTDEKTKKNSILSAIMGLAHNERTPLRVRIASLWSTITSKSGKAISDKLKDIVQSIKEKAKDLNEEELIKEADDVTAEINHQRGVEPVKEEPEFEIKF